jgi:hypothetical protein
MFIQVRRRELFITVDVTNTIWYEIDKEDIYLQLLWVFIVISKVTWHGS